jgi:hypothetical protein
VSRKWGPGEAHGLQSVDLVHLVNGAYFVTIALAVRSPSTAALTMPPA